MNDLSGFAAFFQSPQGLLTLFVVFVLIFAVALAISRQRLKKDLLASLSQQTQKALSEENARTRTELLANLLQVSGRVAGEIEALRDNNASQLEKMRETVDGKMQGILNTRFAEGFRSVNDQLAEVSRGLGEMQKLAADVGGLKAVLSNVKTRGVFGEAQLSNLLEEFLLPAQYDTNVATVPGSACRVEFAVKLPGAEDAPIYLPIDSKFPLTDYERLEAARTEANVEEASLALKAIALRVTNEAKDIAEKYLKVPYTTEFGILFLAIESLYAEVLRIPGLTESIRRKYRVVVAGPTVLVSILTALRMGFKTLAVSARTDELWKRLTKIQTQFKTFADDVGKARTNAETLVGKLEVLQKDVRMIAKSLEAFSLEDEPDSQEEERSPSDR